MSKNAQLDWDDFRYVLAVSREGNLSRAATVLGVSHTTVSRRISTCEERLGATLFDRSPGKLVLTDAGVDILRSAERVESEITGAQRRVMGRDAKLSGPLRVSTLDLLLPLLHDALDGFLQRYPAIDLTLTTTLEPVSLLHRDADVVIRLSNAPPERLIGQRVGRMETAVYASPRLVANVGKSAALDDYPWLAMDRRLNMVHPDAWVDEHVPNARIVARVGESPPLLHAMVRRGVGVYFVPVFVGNAMGLTRLTPNIPAYGIDVWLLTLPELRHVSRVRAFLDMVGPALRTQLRA